MISLYVCDIPQTIEKEELSEIFSCFDGFIEVRIARDRNKQKIAFVDYQTEESARTAMSSTRQFRFPGSSKGITVRYSDNSKNKQTGEVINRPKDDKRQDKSRRTTGEREQRTDRPRNNQPHQRNDRNNDYNNNRSNSDVKSNQGSRDQFDSQFQVPTSSGSRSQYQNQNSSQQPIQPVPFPQQDFQSVNNVQNLQDLQKQLMNTSQNQFNQESIASSMDQNKSTQNLIQKLLSNIENVTKQLNNPGVVTPSQQQPVLNNNPASYTSVAGNAPFTVNSQSIVQPQIPVSAEQSYPSQKRFPEQSSSFFDHANRSLKPVDVSFGDTYGSSQKPNFSKLSDFTSHLKREFDPSKILPIPKNATNTVYVEGIPLDATEREVAHIFRPFQGFKTVRLIPREKKLGEKVILCFADFESTLQTTIVINTLQGYRFDRDDILGLQFSYAITNNKHHNNPAQTSTFTVGAMSQQEDNQALLISESQGDQLKEPILESSAGPPFIPLSNSNQGAANMIPTNPTTESQFQFSQPQQSNPVNFGLNNQYGQLSNDVKTQGLQSQNY